MDLALHARVEGYVLKRRLLPFMKHPGGHHESDFALTVVSLNPILTAAAAHDA